MKSLVLGLLGLCFIGYGLAHNVEPSPYEYKNAIYHLINVTKDTICTVTVISDKEALTAGHCGERNDIVLIGSNSTPPLVASAKFVYYPTVDTGVLHGDFTKFEKIKYKTDIGELDTMFSAKRPLTLCGYAYDGRLFCTKAQVIGRWRDFISVNALVLPGMSGGPVFDENGYEVGVISSFTEDASQFAPNYSIETVLGDK